MCLALQNYQFLYSDKRYNAENRRHLTSRNMDPSIEVRGKYVKKDVNSFYSNEML